MFDIKKRKKIERAFGVVALLVIASMVLLYLPALFS